MKVEMNFQEILHEALSLVKDVPVYFGATHLAQCDKVHRTASRFESFGDAGRENARYACTLIAGVGQSPRVRALCGCDDEAYSYAEEIGRLEKTQNSAAVKRLVQPYRVLDPNCQNIGGTFNGMISKHTAALILRDYEYLVSVFGDFDIEEAEGSDGGYYYLCCPNKILELYR